MENSKKKFPVSICNVERAKKKTTLDVHLLVFCQLFLSYADRGNTACIQLFIKSIFQHIFLPFSASLYLSIS